MVLDISNGADQVLASEAIKTLADIQEKTFAIEPESVSLQLAALMMQKAGLSWQSVTWQSLPPAEMAAAMRSGRIDLVATYAPYSQQVLATGRAHLLFSSADVPNSVVDLLAINPDHWQAHPQTWWAFMRAVCRAVDYYHAHPQQATEIMAAHAGISVDEMKATNAGLIFPEHRQQAGLLQHSGSVVNTLTVVQSLFEQLHIPITQVSAEQLVHNTWSDSHD
jgi:ABC-type nitrate/sulfonate/bicarbonate transport system substrate-binding protein